MKKTEAGKKPVGMSLQYLSLFGTDPVNFEA